MTIHVRRCHICSATNESINSAVSRCEQCRKPFAPFYYFDESKVEGISESGPYLSTWNNSVSYHPIVGLSTYWQESD